MDGPREHRTGRIHDMSTREGIPLLHVGVSAWIIQDGNYRDFKLGQKAKFALEFYPVQDLHALEHGPAVANHITASNYRIRARVVFRGPQAWVIDAGPFMAFQQREPPTSAAQGAWVEGAIYLGIDPFFYFEQLYRLDGMPPLSYQWVVREILRETTPWLETKDQFGRTLNERDESRESFVPAAKTDAWHDDAGHGHYVMACEQTQGPERP